MKSFIKSFGPAISFLLFLNILFWYFGFAGGHIYLKDSYEYLHQAENLKGGNYWYSGDSSLPFNKDLVSQRPPLYGALLLILKSCVFNDHFVLFIQCIISILVFCLILKLLNELGIKLRYPILLVLPLLFFPTQMIYTNMIMSELLCQAMVSLSFYFIVLFLLKHQTKHLLLFFIFISLAILTKPVWYLFWIPLLGFMFYLFWKKRIKYFHFTFVLIPIATVFFICLHNYNQTGYFHYSSVKRTNMENYNVYLTLANKYDADAGFRQILQARKVAETLGSYKEYCQYIEGENTKVIKENIAMYSWLETKGIMNFFLDHGRFDMYCFFSTPPAENMNGIGWYYAQSGISGVMNYLSHFPIGLLIYLPLILLVNIFIALCFLFFLFNKNVPVEIRITAFLFIFYLALITGPIGAARFRMPVYPILLFTLPLGISAMKGIKSKN